MRNRLRDLPLLFLARAVRMFGFGSFSIVLVLYLAKLGFAESAIGLLLSLALLGDAGISLWITTNADRIGRKKMLIASAGLMILAGVVFLYTGNAVLLTLAAIIGVVSPSGSEVGPFLSIEQASITEQIPQEKVTNLFAWYNLVGSSATALGALAGGWLAGYLQSSGVDALASFRAIILLYSVCGLLLLLIFSMLSSAIETTPTVHAKSTFAGLHRSKSAVLKLSGLFVMDSFGGALVVQSIMAYWFHLKFNVEVTEIGAIFFGANLLAAVSALAASSIAKRIGLVKTMVFTHIPSNILLILVPLMPTLEWAVIVLLLRFSISQMDVPARQSYVMAIVAPDERSAAAGITGIARQVGGALSPVIGGYFLAYPGLIGVPFYAAGGIKILYDLLLYRGFRKLKTTATTS